MVLWASQQKFVESKTWNSRSARVSFLTPVRVVFHTLSKKKKKKKEKRNNNKPTERKE